jgi:signal transduction histidine kinase
LIVGDWNGKITQLNPVAEEWLSDPHQKKEILGSFLSDWPKLSRMLPELSEIKRRLTLSGEFRLKTSELEGRIYGGRMMPLLFEVEAEGFVLDLVDLTEDLALQERLGRAESLAVVGRMSAQVAHEIRNPLHSIGLEAELATEVATRLNSIPLKQSLQSIQASVDRLNRITENYLKLSRLSSGQKKAMDLAQVLEAVLATYANECGSAGVEIDWNVQEGSLEIWGDEDLIEQALGNLFRNALQAVAGSEKKKIVWNLGQAESGRIWLSIEDSGHGFNEEIKAKLFTPYFTTRAQGTGLGLSFVKKLIEEHAGQIEAKDSVKLGGAKFEMIFPHFTEIKTREGAAWLES